MSAHACTRIAILALLALSTGAANAQRGAVGAGEVRYYIPQHDAAVPSGGGGFGAMGEGVTVDAAGNIYGGEVGSITGITKFVPRLLPR